MLLVANAPCSWGVLEFDPTNKPATYTQVLDELARAGYGATELGDWGFMPTEPDRLRAELDARGIQLLGAFVPVALRAADAHVAGAEAAVRTARLLADVANAKPGAPRPFVVLADENGADATRVRLAGRIRPEHGLSDAEWDTFAHGAEQIACAVRDKTALRTVFHHHCAGYVETPAEIDALLARTSPELLGLCFDTGHYTFGGGDALEGLQRHADRIWHVHFKDCRPDVVGSADDYFAAVRNGVFCELGQGVVPFPAVIATLNARGFNGWAVVEQDVLPGMGTPFESARRNRAYLATLGI